MIRRGFWLAVGAAGGIMGYRKASALGQQVSATLGLKAKTPKTQRRHATRETFRFARDVREGMDLYIDRHHDRSASTLGARTVSGHMTNDEREDH
jgi:hypothetical protein